MIGMDRPPVLKLVLALLCVCSLAEARSPWVNVGGAEFLDLRAYSQAQNYDYSWDPVAKNLLLQGAGGHFRFHVGSEYFLKNGRLEKMGEKARFWNDSVMAPGSAAALLPAVPERPAAPSAEIWAVPATVTRAATYRIRKVVLDAGHGGKDSGAISANGLQEKRVALEVARDVQHALEALGIEVLMTRSADVFIPLSQRAHIANKNGADLFVSIHANASPSRSLDGFEIYTLSEATDDQALAVERAENSVIRLEPAQRASMSNSTKAILWDLKETQNRKESLHAAQHILDEVTGSVSVAARRQRSANFFVLKWTECPAVLIELAYLSNRADEKKLRDPAYKSAMASAIVRGLWAYITDFQNSDGYTR